MDEDQALLKRAVLLVDLLLEQQRVGPEMNENATFLVALEPVGALKVGRLQRQVEQTEHKWDDIHLQFGDLGGHERG